MKHFRCTSALLMKRQHGLSRTPAAKFDSFQLCFLSASFVRSGISAFGCTAEQDGDRHLPIAPSVLVVINEPVPP